MFRINLSTQQKTYLPKNYHGQKSWTEKTKDQNLLKTIFKNENELISLTPKVIAKLTE